MDSNQKMAIVGSGLVVTGIGLGIFCAALIVPAVVAWGGRLLEHRCAQQPKSAWLSRGRGAMTMLTAVGRQSRNWRPGFSA